MDWSIIMQYIRPEMLVLIPALYVIGMAIKQTEAIKDKFIPLILGGVGIVLAVLLLVSTGNIETGKDMIACVFAGVTQGFLCAGASVYANQIFKQAKKEDK